MKKLFLALALVAVTGYAAETKKVCVDSQKNGKTVQTCKEIKIHQKLEGTKVSDAKKDQAKK